MRNRSWNSCLHATAKQTKYMFQQRKPKEDQLEEVVQLIFITNLITGQLCDCRSKTFVQKY